VEQSWIGLVFDAPKILGAKTSGDQNLFHENGADWKCLPVQVEREEWRPLRDGRRKMQRRI